MTRAESQHHTVTVMVEPWDPDETDYPEVRLEFTCTAHEDAECRTYPDCDCEVFSEGDDPGHDQAGHEYISGRTCWLRDWFDAGCAIFTGRDRDNGYDHEHPAIARTGHVEVRWELDWIEWQFSGEPELLPMPAPLMPDGPETDTPEPEPDPRWDQTGPDLIDALGEAS